MGNRLICGCDRVYEDAIRQAIREGAATFEEVQKATGCGNGCGNCRLLVEKLLRSAREESRADGQ